MKICTSCAHCYECTTVSASGGNSTRADCTWLVFHASDCAVHMFYAQYVR